MEHLHGSFTQGTIELLMFAWRFCIVYNRVLNVCRTVLRREQKGIERLQDGFAPCTKGH